MKYFTIILLLLGMPLLYVSAQQPSRIIKGKVISAIDRLPLQGVNLTLKNQKKILVTDKDGEFILSLSEAVDFLILSHVGYIGKEVKINSTTKSNLIITLQKTQSELEPVTVSTGFQKLPKERAVGSFTQIDNKLYNEQVGTDLLSRLKFISNGVSVFPQRINSSVPYQILIRGLSTMTMRIQKPLIIVDNFEYQGDLENINPNDVDNITFLKDATASSLWGAKAANGVIVITTKKGRFNKDIEIEFNSNVSFIEEPDLYSLKNISSSDLIDVETYLFNKQYRFPDTSNIYHPVFSPVYEILFAERNGQISLAEAQSEINALREIDVRKDFKKYMYQRAINQQYYMNVRGGTNRNAWILSLGFDKNKNELSARYDRITGRLENMFKLAKNIEVNASINFSQSETHSGKPGYGDITTNIGAIPTYSKFADDRKNPLPLYTKYREPYIDTAGGGNLLDWKYYPLTDYKHTRNTTRLQDINSVIGIAYKFSDALNVDIKYRFERQVVENRLLYDEQSFYTRDLINNYSQLEWNSGQVTYKIPKGEILDLSNNWITSHNIRLQGNFNKTWVKHSFTALAGSEISQTVNESNSNRTYGFSSDILTQGMVDYANTYPLLSNGRKSFIPNQSGFSKTKIRIASFFLNGAYTYDNRYTITMSARRDASNLFGLDINDKWKPLWSLGAGWNISSEKFYTIDALPYLRIRGTYGSQGNIDPSKVAVTTFLYIGTNPFTLNQYGEVEDFINPDLKWEQVNMLNIGLDFSLKGRRVSGSIEFFKKDIKDLYAPSIVDPTSGLGVSAITKNIGSMKGNGLDIEFNTVNIDKGIKWSSNVFLNYYQDKVTRFYDINTLPSKGQLVSSGLIGLEGYSPFSLFAYRWGGLDPSNGDPLGFLNGNISNDWSGITGDESKLSDIRYIGNLIPLYSGSLGNTLAYKSFSLSFRITFKFKYYFRRQSIKYNNLVQTMVGHADYALRWQNPGDEKNTNVPSLSYPISQARDAFYGGSEILVEKGDHIRFQYLNLSYTIDREKMNKLPVKNIQVYSVVNNIGLLWKANDKNLDPDFATLPPALSYSIGIKVFF